MNRCLYKLMLPLALSLCLLCGVGTIADAHKKAYTDSLFNALTNAQIDTLRAAIQIRIASAYMPDSVTRQFYYANEALSLSEKAGWDMGQMRANQLIADCYLRVKAYRDALTYYKRSITLAKKLKDTSVEAYSLQYMLHAYHELDELDNAASCQKQVVDIVKALTDTLNTCHQMSTYALCLKDADRCVDGIAYMYQTINFIKTNLVGHQRDDMLADVLNTLSTIYVKVNKTDSALYCLRTATALLNGRDKRMGAYLISSFCDVYTAGNIYDSAILYGEQTVKMAGELHEINLEQHYCDVLYHLYEGSKQAGPALFYYKKSDSLLKTINDVQRTMDQAMQVTRINMEQQARHNKLEKKSLETIRKNQKTALIAALVAVIALILLSLFIYRSLMQKQKANRTISRQAADLEEQNAVIDNALKEKDVLLKETHHRIKNNLQLISSLLELQAANLDDEGVKNALHTAQRRVLSIATVHSKLYGSGDEDRIEFAAFASDLFARLQHAFGREERMIQYEQLIPETFLPLHTVVLLGLILNELITNSFKYAFTDSGQTAIQVSFVFDGISYTLCYKDNGPGLPETAFDEHSGSLGLYLVKRLSKQLKGNFTYQFDAGSIFTIIFPHAGN